MTSSPASVLGNCYVKRSDSSKLHFCDFKNSIGNSMSKYLSAEKFFQLDRINSKRDAKHIFVFNRVKVFRKNVLPVRIKCTKLTKKIQRIKEVRFLSSKKN